MSKASTNRISDISYPGADRKVKVAIPGIQSLHHRPTNEIGEVLSNAILSQANVTEVKYVLGKYIELTINNTPPDGIVFEQVY